MMPAYNFKTALSRFWAWLRRDPTVLINYSMPIHTPSMTPTKDECLNHVRYGILSLPEIPPDHAVVIICISPTHFGKAYGRIMWRKYRSSRGLLQYVAHDLLKNDTSECYVLGYIGDIVLGKQL